MSGIKANYRPVKTVILSAGRGRRLLSLTKDIPKCLIPISSKPIIEWQVKQNLTRGPNRC